MRGRLGYLESHARRVAVPRLRVIDGYYEYSSGAVLSSNRITQICREGRNSTLAREVVPDNRYRTGSEWLKRNPWPGQDDAGFFSNAKTESQEQPT
jgi:hypothetical protein